jgi:hypothetical protein
MRSCVWKGFRPAGFFALLGWSAFFLCFFSIFTRSFGLENIPQNMPQWHEDGQYYTIADAEQFATFRDWVNDGTSTDQVYKLTADICLNSGDWTPIGANMEKYFTDAGVLSGDGHIVSGFKVIGNKHKFAGLFGYFKGSISDLGVTDFVVSVDHTGTIYAGGLVGNNSGGSITGSYTMGSVSATTSGNLRAGGLVGGNSDVKGRITACYSMSDVTTLASSYVGGLVGDNNGEITDSYAAGRVSSFTKTNVGGFIGQNAGSVIQNCAFDTQGTGQMKAIGKENSSAVPDVTGAPTSDNIWANVGKFPADRWIVNAGYYPQLKVFANAESEAVREMSAKMSALSAVPVFLTSRDEPEKDTASDVTGAFLIPKRTPPVSDKKVGIEWTVKPEGALRYAESGDLWEVSAVQAGEIELTAAMPNSNPSAEKHFKLKITQAFGSGGESFPIPEPLDPVLPVPKDKLGDAGMGFNEEYKNEGVQVEFPKYALNDSESVGKQLGEKNPVLVVNSDVERVSLTLTDGTGFAGGAGLMALGGGRSVAIEVFLDSEAEEGEIDLFSVQLIFVLSSSDLENAGLDASQIVGNAEAFLEKAAVVKLPDEGSHRTPLRLNAWLKDVLIVSRDESPENPGGVRILLPYLLADAPGEPQLVSDGQVTRLVLFDGSKNACLRDPIWLYRAEEKPEESGESGETEEPGGSEEPGGAEEPGGSDEPEGPGGPGEPGEPGGLGGSEETGGPKETEEPEGSGELDPEESGDGDSEDPKGSEETEESEMTEESGAPEESEEPNEPEEPESGEPDAPTLVVFPARLSLPENEIREVTAFISGDVSVLGAARGVVWRVGDDAVASIDPTEEAMEDGDLDVWAVTGLKAGYTKMTASVSVKSFADDAVLLSASLGVTVTSGDRESEIAESSQGGCNAPATGAGMNIAGLIFALAPCLALRIARRRGIRCSGNGLKHE